MLRLLQDFNPPNCSPRKIENNNLLCHNRITSKHRTRNEVIAMKYLADILTLSRIVLAFVVGAMIVGGSWHAAFALFVLAALTDVVDGPCARRWPYSDADDERLPWRRIDPRFLDDIGDITLVAASAVMLAMHYRRWIIIAAIFAALEIVLSQVVVLATRRGYGTAAERADVLAGWNYALLIAAIIVELTARISWPWYVVVIELISIGVLLDVKWDRATARPETRQRAEPYTLIRELMDRVEEFDRL